MIGLLHVSKAHFSTEYLDIAAAMHLLVHNLQSDDVVRSSAVTQVRTRLVCRSRPFRDALAASVKLVIGAMKYRPSRFIPIITNKARLIDYRAM